VPDARLCATVSGVALSATPADSAAKGQRKLDKFVTYIPRPSVNPYLHGRHGLPHPAKRQYVPSTGAQRGAVCCPSRRAPAWRCRASDVAV
jgi:hypothetical protein